MIDYSKGTYYGGAGLPVFSREGQNAVYAGGSGRVAGELLAGISPALLSAIMPGIGTIAGGVISGIGALYAAHQQQKDRERQEQIEGNRFAVNASLQREGMERNFGFNALDNIAKQAQEAQAVARRNKFYKELTRY